LEEAHERGIVHRDLKPANIKLTPDDKIKVLDFGLAKAFVEEGSEIEAATSMSPTITRDATRVGVILGTAAYMSPEQAKGKRVDKRADVWAFAIVLYEMLTGQRAFDGEDVSETLALVLTKEPNWDVLPSTTPAAVRQVLRLCATKDVKLRARDMGDVRLAMGGAFETVAEVRSRSDEAAATRAGWRGVVPVALGAALVAAVISGLAVWASLRSPDVAVKVTRLTIDSAGPLDYESHRWPSAVPNSDVVLFVVRSADRFGDREGELATLSLDTGEVKRLGLNGTNPRYVRTGHLVYGVADGTMRAVAFDPERLAVTSGPVPLGENVVVKISGAADFDLSDAGRLVYVEGSGPGAAHRHLLWVSRDGREEPIDASAGAYNTPHISPDGTRVAVDRADADGVDIWTLDLSRGTETKLTADAFVEANPLWTPDGTGVVYGSAFASDGGIFRKSADGTGEAERLMSVPSGTAVVGPSAWSADGTILAFWIVNPVSTDIGLLSLGGNGTPTPLFDAEFLEQVPAISPDGKWIAYESDESGEGEIYVQRFPELGQRATISTDGGRQPVWSRDGRELFYRSADGMMAVPIDLSPTFRAGQPTLLFEDDYFYFLSRRTYDVAPDGQRFLMVTADDTTAGSRSFRMVVVDHWFEELESRVPTGN
jgi:hypothetical protein